MHLTLHELERCWLELRQCLRDMAMNGGQGNQQETCLYILHLMDVFEGKVVYR